MALTKVTGQVINSTTDLSVGVATVGGGTSTGDLYVVGVSTLVGDLSLNGNVSIGGTLTYEDVTNVDSVGLITARSGISVTGGTVKVGTGITLSTDGDVYTTGVSTFTGNVLIGGPSHTSRPLVVHAATNSVVSIEGNSDGTSSIMLGDNDDEDVGMIQYNHADNDLAFTVNTGEALAIKSDGQLVSAGTGAELNLTNTGSTATESTGYFYTSVSGIHNQLTIKTSTNNGGDPYIKFDGGGQDMIVGERYAGTTNNLLVLGPGNNPDTTSGIFVKGNGLIGVGTDNPQKDVHIESATPFLRLEDTTSASKRLDLWIETSDGYIGCNQSSQDLHFQTASSNRITITAAGKCHLGLPDVTNTWDTHAISLGTNSATFPTPATVVLVGGTAYNTANYAGSGIRFTGKYNSSNAYTTFAHVSGIKENTTDGNYAGALTFHTRVNGGDGAERMRITSAGLLEIKGSGEGGPHVYRDGGNGPDIVLSGCRGTIASPTASAGTDLLGNINFQGYDGSGYHRRASINGHIDGTVVDGSNTLPTAMIFKTGTTGTTERMRISSSGAITMPTQIRFLARAGGSGDGNTASPYTFSSEVFDNGDCYDGTNKFTAPVAGVYYFAVHAGYKQTGYSFGTRIRRYNSSNVQQEEYEVWRLVSSDDPDSHSGGAGSCLMQCAVGDYVQCFPQFTPYHVNSTLCFFCGHLLS